jgi:aminoglycoside phosphotransferase (APT) family kinase protein
VSGAAPVIDTALARALVDAQFPQWAELPLRPVDRGGWDNRSFRLGEALLVRLPSRGRYAASVVVEQRWLPQLASQLPLPIPEPVGLGAPGEGYPWPWSVYRWLEGAPADAAPVDDTVRFARDLGGFLRALQAADAAGGPTPGPGNFHRGGSARVYDGEVWAALAALGGQVDGDGAAQVWRAAQTAEFAGPPVWVHGDVAPGNLLVKEGRLAAVIDFGQMTTGDPACDLAIAWTFFDGEARAAFREAVAMDAATWARARGWALWKAAIVAAGLPGTNPAGRSDAGRVLAAVIEEHREG